MQCCAHSARAHAALAPALSIRLLFATQLTRLTPARQARDWHPTLPWHSAGPRAALGAVDTNQPLGPRPGSGLSEVDGQGRYGSPLPSPYASPLPDCGPGGMGAAASGGAARRREVSEELAGAEEAVRGRWQEQQQLHIVRSNALFEL